MNCISEDTILSFLNGELSDDDRALVDEHLFKCQLCSQLLIQLARDSLPENKSPAAPANDSNLELTRARTIQRPILNPIMHHPLLSTGTIVDHFEIIRLIGKGGMGEVYLAKDRNLRRKVALKIIRPDFADSKQKLDRFLFEAQATARFSHPHIVTIYEIGKYGDALYFALEYLNGITLRQLIEQKPLKINECLRIAGAIASALKEAHHVKILHRDLKPENIILPQDGRLRVLDFGLAKMIGRPATLLTTINYLTERERPSTKNWHDFLSEGQVIRGTPAYMAPEQWSQESCTEASDIWAWGVILFEILTGQHPYSDFIFNGLYQEVTHKKPVPTLHLIEKYPIGLKSLIKECLDKNPTMRPSAAQIVERLEPILFMYSKPHASFILASIPLRLPSRHSIIFKAYDVIRELFKKWWLAFTIGGFIVGLLVIGWLIVQMRKDEPRVIRLSVPARSVYGVRSKTDTIQNQIITTVKPEQPEQKNPEPLTPIYSGEEHLEEDIAGDSTGESAEQTTLDASGFIEPPSDMKAKPHRKKAKPRRKTSSKAAGKTDELLDVPF